ncbi:MAG: DNA primase [Candidatus Omnitrophica bacterium]|nr:DNA primase [Candidatus Omnitrophota bacterium]
MGRIPQEIIDQVLDRTDIVEVISGYVNIKKAGRNFKGCCPFHDEKTPSFVVSPDKQIYHCFGCSAGGNAVGFVMRYENMEFPEALRMLAEKAGVEVPEQRADDGMGGSISAKLYEVNGLAAEYYHKLMKSRHGAAAREYLKARGMTGGTADTFMIGYSPDSWESLRKYCETKGFSPAVLRKAGLTVPSDKGRGDYDRFRKRIIFPIFNERGKIVAFGGRVMDDSLPKYINSPETPVYNKSGVLYGLNFARKSMRDKGCAVIVEGYMDVIMTHQYGVKNIVATSGTALTSRQAAMLKRYTKTAVMLFDSDQAGETASLRGLDILIEHGMEVRVAALPSGEDPDSYIKKKGREAFESVLEQAKGLFEYKLDLLIGRLGKRDVGGIVDEMLPTISKVGNAVVQSDYLKKLAERLGVHEASLRYELGKVKPDYSYRSGNESGPPSGKRASYKTGELHLLGLALTDGKRASRIREETPPGSFSEGPVKDVILRVFDLYGKGVTAREIPGRLLDEYGSDEQRRGAVVQALARAEIGGDPDKAMDDCLCYLKKERRDEKLRSLTLRLKKAQESNNGDEMRELLVKINKIHKEKVT